MDTAFIPESWQPVIAQWAVYVLGALAVTSALVHVLAPIARRVQRWTLTTAATWDDGPSRWTADRLEWLSGALAVVLPMLPHITALRDERPAKRRDPITKAPPSGGALALVLVVVAAACAVAASGCSAGPQLPVVTVPINIACSWNINPPRSSGEATVDTPTSADATASWVVADNDCTVDRSSAAGEANPIGNDLHGAQVSPSLTASVPISGTGGVTP